MRTTHWILSVLTFVLVLTRKDVLAAESKAKEPPIVYVEDAQEKSLFDNLVYPGVVASKSLVTYTSDMDASIQKVFVHIGQHVKKGQPLLSLENKDPVYTYAPRAIVATLSGVVSSLDVSEGQTVAKGAKLASVLDRSKLKVQIEVPPSDLASMKMGLDGELTLSGSETPVPVRVVGVSPSVDMATGTAPAELEPVKKDVATLLPGKLGKVIFKINVRKGIEIAEQAVVYKDGQAHLRIVENEKVHFQKVKLGMKRGGLVEITDGLKAGNAVVVRTSGFLAEGETVVVQRAGMVNK